MHHKLPLEIILCVVEFVKHDKATLLKLLLLSRALHSIVEPCIYEAACFRQEPNIQAAKLQSFSRNVIKNGGALGIHVRKFVLIAPSECFGRSAVIAHILPHLTCLTHFEVSQAWRIPGHVKPRIFSAFRTSQLSTFIWEEEDKDEAIQERDLLEFLQSHPSITHLEIPTFTFTSPLPPSVLLPRVEKLVVRSYQHLLNTPTLQMVSHLGIGVPDDLSVVGMDAEEVFSRIQYFTALGLFDSEDFATLSSHLPNLRGLVYNPDMFIPLEEIIGNMQAHTFRSKQLEYLALSSTVQGEETADQVLRQVFDAISTLRIIDLYDDERSSNEFVRYRVDGRATPLPLSEYPKYWPTEEDLD